MSGKWNHLHNFNMRKFSSRSSIPHNKWYANFVTETSYENMDGTNEHYMEDGETSDGDFAITHCLAIKEEKVAALECFSPRQHTSIIGEFSLPQELSEHPAKVEATEVMNFIWPLKSKLQVIANNND